jgi:hypothetical protein
MASRRVEAEIDRLFQLAPDEFTAARNALAKDAGADAPEVRRLTKPAVAAWAINQLHWKRRPVYDALIAAAKDLRQTHKAVLAGRSGDLRAVGKVHEEALETASKAALSVLQDGGHPVTDATRHAILTTLRALPSDEPAGRLTRALQPGGFEMLAGLSIGGGQRAEFRKKPEAEPPKPVAKGKVATPEKIETKPMTAAQKRAHEQAVSRAREAAAKADRELRAAEHTAQREEFEAARSAREAEKAVKQVEVAREAVEAAEQALATAKTAAVAAARVRDAAERRSKEAQRAVEAARARSQAADNLSPGRSSARG